MENISRDLIADETQTAKKTVANHGREIELLATMLNLYINGFSMTGSLNDQNTDTNWVWLFLLTRSFHSLRCSVGLILVGAPGGRKTTTIGLLGIRDPLKKLDTFTPASFVSHDASKTEASLRKIDLLPQIKHKIMVRSKTLCQN